MTQEYNTQRNVLLTVLAAAAAIGLGFLLGRVGGRGEPAERGVYETAAEAPATAPANALVEESPTPN